jgi:hypothetical protein
VIEPALDFTAAAASFGIAEDSRTTKASLASRNMADGR